MGYSLSWAAVKGGNAEAVHSIVGVRATGTREETPESGTLGAVLPTGWYLLLFNRKEMDDEILEQLSNLGEVVYCFVEDHVMFSRASGWRSGKAAWSVVHDCEKGRYHIEINGIAPPSLESIRRKLVAQQDAEGGEKAEIDWIYEVPAELAKDLTGFRHDEDASGMAGNTFQVLEAGSKQTKKTGSNILSRFFGRKSDQ